MTSILLRLLEPCDNVITVSILGFFCLLLRVFGQDLPGDSRRIRPLNF